MERERKTQRINHSIAVATVMAYVIEVHHT